LSLWLMCPKMSMRELPCLAKVGGGERLSERV
jgi:hypothetical protein